MLGKFLKIILKVIMFIVKEVSSFFIRIILFLCLIVIIFVMIRGYQQGKKEMKNSRQYSYLEIDMGK